MVNLKPGVQRRPAEREWSGRFFRRDPLSLSIASPQGSSAKWAGTAVTQSSLSLTCLSLHTTRSHELITTWQMRPIKPLRTIIRNSNGQKVIQLAIFKCPLIEFFWLKRSALWKLFKAQCKLSVSEIEQNNVNSVVLVSILPEQEMISIWSKKFQDILSENWWTKRSEKVTSQRRPQTPQVRNRNAAGLTCIQLKKIRKTMSPPVTVYLGPLYIHYHVSICNYCVVGKNASKVQKHRFFSDDFTIRP